MRDPKVRDAVARATYQGLQKYFNSVDSGATGLTFLPDAATDVVATTNGDGTVTLNWTPPVGSAVHGGTPTGYMVYTSPVSYTPPTLPTFYPVEILVDPVTLKKK